MNHLSEIRQLVNEDTGEVMAHSYRKGVKQLLLHDKWACLFFKSLHAFADANVSKSAYIVFLYLLGDGMSGNEMIIDKEGLAKRMGIKSSSFVRRVIRELVDANVLIEGKRTRGQPTYRFNPRIAWSGKLANRPADLSSYPEIGVKKNGKKSISTSARPDYQQETASRERSDPESLHYGDGDA